MNLLTLMHQEYVIDAFEVYYDEKPYKYSISLECRKINNSDGYSRITKIELETLRDNAKRLYEACNNALSEEERI